MSVFAEWLKSYAGLDGPQTMAGFLGWRGSSGDKRMKRTMKDFAERTRTTAKYGDGVKGIVMHSSDQDLEALLRLSYLTNGMASEAGEVAGAMKKYLRGDYDQDEMIRRIRKETGDVLWYVGRLYDELGLDMDLEAELLLAKLMDRAEHGNITGDGDDR